MYVCMYVSVVIDNLVYSFD